LVGKVELKVSVLKSDFNLNAINYSKIIYVKEFTPIVFLQKRDSHTCLHCSYYSIDFQLLQMIRNDYKRRKTTTVLMALTRLPLKK
jgi:hypothetical protein